MKDTVLRQILRHKNRKAYEMGTYKAFTSPVWRTIQKTGIEEMPVFLFACPAGKTAMIVKGR